MGTGWLVVTFVSTLLVVVVGLVVVAAVSSHRTDLSLGDD